VNGGRAAARRIAALGDATRRWGNADFPPRVRATAALVRRTRYSEPVVEYALDRLFGGLRGDVLESALVDECGTLEALDGFVRRADGTSRHAAGVGAVAIVASATTIGVALVPAVFAMCADCEVVVREYDDELVGAFAATLAEEDVELAARLRTLPAAAYDDPGWTRTLGSADAVVAFGGEEALRAIRAQVSGDARFIAYGHRTSVAYVAREALADERCARACAEGLARDALLYDGEGCLSAHVGFVERDAPVATERFAALLRDALERTAVEFPVGARDVAAALAGPHASARFRAALGSGTTERGDAGRFLLTLDPPAREGPPLVPRALALVTVDGPQAFTAYVHRHALVLEALAVSAGFTRDDVVAAALSAGVTRIARIGALQDPSFGAPHGGLGRVTPFVRWIARDA
jgi:hypothetical protein